MNLNDFEKTNFTGLYKSKISHPIFGKKYIARFQVLKKRYMKVLGYDKVDNLTDIKAYSLLENYKNTLTIHSKQLKTVTKTIKADTEQNIKIDNAEKILQLKEENIFLKSLIGNYKTVNLVTLKEGIQKVYDNAQMQEFQVELIKMQDHLEKSKQKMIILFEGRDASGKGGAIRRMTRYMNARHYKVVALGKPTKTQKGQWFFQKYIEHFPTGGETVLFDRSWYNRAMVEPIFGFCTNHEYQIFMEDVVNFEHDLVRQDIILVKLYFSVSKIEQLKRFEIRRTNPLKQWKLSEVDLQAQDLWKEFSEKKYEMLKRTHSPSAPWNVIRSDDKHKARMEAIKIVLNSVDYEDKNYSLNFEPAENINISVQKELARMRKKNDY
jgi:polyphosphate kinase